MNILRRTFMQATSAAAALLGLGHKPQQPNPTVSEVQTCDGPLDAYLHTQHGCFYASKVYIDARQEVWRYDPKTDILMPSTLIAEMKTLGVRNFEEELAEQRAKGKECYIGGRTHVAVMIEAIVGGKQELLDFVQDFSTVMLARNNQLRIELLREQPSPRRCYEIEDGSLHAYERPSIIVDCPVMVLLGKTIHEWSLSILEDVQLQGTGCRRA